MNNWKDFENSCVTYLNKEFGTQNVKFLKIGQSDSTVSDINVLINGVSAFLIEAKMPSAQSGQFVTLINDDCFCFSPQNKTDLNFNSAAILNFLNDNFETYKNVGTAALGIEVPHHFFSNWIKDYYKSKNVKFVITMFNGRFVIFPLKQYDYYFKIAAYIRRKKSGSSHLPKSYIEPVIDYLENTFKTSFEIKEDNKKKVLLTEENLENLKFNLENLNFFISNDGNNFIIKKLSSTNNPTVIFSVLSTREQNVDDFNLFKETLNR